MAATSEVLASWSYARTAPGEAPGDFVRIGEARCVGRLLADAGRDPIELGGHDDLDAFDHHYRTTLNAREVAEGSRVSVRLPVVATIGTVSWNDEIIHESQTSFVPVVVDLTDRITGGGTLDVCCHSLNAWLGATKRQRPRYRSRLVADQRLRFARASLLGRIPAWSPPVPAVGLSGSTELLTESGAQIDSATFAPRVMADGEGELRVHVELARLDGVVGATLTCGGQSTTLEIASSPNPSLAGSLRIPEVRRWWPHTHGEPNLYDVSLHLDHADGNTETRSLGRTGFRELVVDRGIDGEGFAITLNGINVFCRGSAWMPLDPRDPHVGIDELRSTLTRCREAGLNMLRLTGVTGWEQPEFYDLCAELGIMIWQDIPFATLDQPTDADFVRALTIETRSNLRRFSSSPAIAVVCGASERQQQAAMLGLDQAVITDAVGSAVLAEELESLEVDMAFVACSPSGGHLPFIADRGVSHYYGVGAYLRPLSDARHANVRFTSECLAFANVPEPATIDRLLADGDAPPTHPRWKQRVPRDRGAGWDFEDVRDHYLAVVTGEDPFALRQRDVDRYLELGRVTSAVVMTSAFQEWRRPSSSCAGALTWFLRDLWRGAGWGLIDSDGRAKAAFGALADTWSPVAIGLIDEGVNGVDVWVHNDRPEPFAGVIELCLVRDTRSTQLHRTDTIAVPPHGSLHLRADELVGRFTDPSDAYRFGPRDHDGMTARLIDDHGSTIARYVLDTSGGLTFRRSTPAWSASAMAVVEGIVTLDVRAVDLVRDLRIEDSAFTVDRHHVDVVPGENRRFLLRHSGTTPGTVTVGAVNARGAVRVHVQSGIAEERDDAGVSDGR